MKRCTKCRKRKPLTSFHKHKPSADGRKPRCKRCQCSAEKARRYVPASRAVQMWHDMNKRVRTQIEYCGVKVLISREDFIAWAVPELIDWFAGTPDVRPSVDRRDPAGHYEEGNLRLLSIRRNSQLRRGTKNPYAPLGTAWCSGHQEYLPVDNFEKNKSRGNGLQHKCKECRRRMRAADRQILNSFKNLS